MSEFCYIWRIWVNLRRNLLKDIFCWTLWKNLWIDKEEDSVKDIWRDIYKLCLNWTKHTVDSGALFRLCCSHVHLCPVLCFKCEETLPFPLSPEISLQPPDSEERQVPHGSAIRLPSWDRHLRTSGGCHLAAVNLRHHSRPQPDSPVSHLFCILTFVPKSHGKSVNTISSLSGCSHTHLPLISLGDSPHVPALFHFPSFTGQSLTAAAPASLHNP